MASDVEKVIEVLLAVRKAVGDETSSSTTVAFLIIATSPDILSADLFKRLELSTNAASRATSVLLEQHRGGREGLDLVEAVEDPVDRRKRRYHLTAKGEAVWKKVQKALNQDSKS